MSKYRISLVFRLIDFRFVCLTSGQFENKLLIDVLHFLDDISFPDSCQFARYRTKNFYVLIKQYNSEKITIDYYDAKYF